MVQILDGKGTGKLVGVDDKHRILVRGVVEGPLEDASEEKGNAFYVTSSYSAVATTVISIQNGEQDLDLHISRIHMGSSEATTWKLFEVTAGTATGSVLTYANPNLRSGVQHTMTVFGDSSVGALTGNTLGVFNSVAAGGVDVFLEGSLILGNTDQVAIQTLTSGNIEVTVIGFFDD